MQEKKKFALVATSLLLLLVIAMLLNKYAFKKEQPVENQSILQEIEPQKESEEDIKSQMKISFYISPTGNDKNDGKTQETAFKTIQKAVDLAMPGDVIFLSDGEYMQDVASKRNGEKENPIIITGSPKATVKGGGGARIVEINHDYMTLHNFTVDGLFGEGQEQTDYRDKLIYVQGIENKKGVTGLKINKMTIKNAGGECVRMRYFAQENEISENEISTCGAHDFLFDAGGKNGEAIYIGTAPEQTKDGKNPTSDMDKSNKNWIHGNKIDTQGNECVDIKEGSSENIVENNSCTGQKDPESAGLDSRGSKNIFRNNNVHDNIGAGVRLGGDTKDDGIKNDVYFNILKNNKGGGIKAMRGPQGKICSNIMENNEDGDFIGDEAKGLSNEKCKQ